METRLARTKKTARALRSRPSRGTIKGSGSSLSPARFSRLCCLELVSWFHRWIIKVDQNLHFRDSSWAAAAKQFVVGSALVVHPAAAKWISADWRIAQFLQRGQLHAELLRDQGEHDWGDSLAHPSSMPGAISRRGADRARRYWRG